MTTREAAGSGVRPAHRLAGGALVLVGALNVLFGVLALATDAIALSGGIASTLIVAGLVLGSAGVLVGRGSSTVAMVTLAILGVLLVVELGTLAASAIEPELHLPRIAVLALLVAVLVPAARAGGRRRPRP